MKKIRLQSIALLLIISGTFTSCLSDDIPTENISLKDAKVTNVSGPDVAELNTEITLNVTYNVDNNCGHFNKFKETTDGNTKTIVLEAYYDTFDCAGEIIKAEKYKFKEPKSGTYILNFKKNDSTYITKSIVVN